MVLVKRFTASSGGDSGGGDGGGGDWDGEGGGDEGGGVCLKCELTGSVAKIFVVRTLHLDVFSCFGVRFF